jgi:hypothetical protein
MQRYNLQGQHQVPTLRTHDLLCRCIDQLLELVLLGLQHLLVLAMVLK